MPLFFANARHGMSRRQRGQTDRVEYQRSSLTQTLMIVENKPSVGEWVITIMMGWMHAVLQAAYDPVDEDDREDKAWGTQLGTYFPTKYPLTQAILWY
jgi:hypothetical protein